MTNFLAQRRAQALNRETAWACLTSNLGLPGFGSLLAGRLSAVPQLLLSGAGMLLTMAYGVRFISWFLQNQARLQDPDADPIATLSELWLAVRWALVGIGLFALAWIWALGTGYAIVQAAKKAGRNSAPPKLPGLP